MQQLDQFRSGPSLQGGLHDFHTEEKQGKSKCYGNYDFTKHYGNPP
ncbi:MULTISPECIES: hypothetical protein [Paenibacillus]|nr:hypothetical protein [Paenibacillus anaericanus]